MSVWLTIPSARPPEEAERVLNLWEERGYKIALWRDAKAPDIRLDSEGGTYYSFEEYPGYAKAINYLIAEVMIHDPYAEWFIAAGDDIEPDPNHSAEEIAQMCGEHFYFLRRREHKMSTFGVMQPTGDRWGDRGDGKGAYIDRVCGSAWIGREFARRVNQGRGPLWPEYTHMFVDEELQAVAQKYGVLWQRRDLTQMHRHWGRGPEGNPNALQDFATAVPEHLKEVNTPEHWHKYKALFEQRKAAGFPGSGLL